LLSPRACVNPSSSRWGTAPKGNSFSPSASTISLLNCCYVDASAALLRLASGPSPERPTRSGFRFTPGDDGSAAPTVSINLSRAKQELIRAGASLQQNRGEAADPLRPRQHRRSRQYQLSLSPSTRFRDKSHLYCLAHSPVQARLPAPRTLILELRKRARCTSSRAPKSNIQNRLHPGARQAAAPPLAGTPHGEVFAFQTSPKADDGEARRARLSFGCEKKVKWARNLCYNIVQREPK
jgi:hypothetical protein